MRAVLILLFSVAGVLAADFTTLDGTKYREVTVKRVEADGIVVITDVGVEKIYFNELPKEVQERYRAQASASTAVAVRVLESATATPVEQTSTVVATRVLQSTPTPAQPLPPAHTYELKQDYVIGGDTGSVVKRLTKGQRYRGRDVPDGIKLDIDGKMYTVPRDILSAAKD
jgi:hypothetical protein